MSRAVVLAYLACAAIWGTTWFAIRVCIRDYGTLDALALRFALATLAMVPIVARRRSRRWPTASQWRWLIVAGVLDAAGYLLVYTGEERVSGGIAAVVYGTLPLVLAVILAITKLETITRRHVIGAAISIAGVAILVLDRLEISVGQAIGVLLVEGSVILATVYSTIMKRHAREVDGVVSTTIFLAVTAVVLAIVAIVVGDGRAIPWPPPPASTAALVYLALIGSVAAFLAYFWLLQATTLIVTSTLVFCYPVVALATDVLFERDIHLTWRVFLGAGIVLGGLAVSLRRRNN